ncbi:MAG: alpha/beta hydrolase [Acetobacteraceae bacterium]|nr:alpha/beta hydrolase [Acetobacteraceae bacterium]
MIHIEQQSNAGASGAEFREGFVDADRFHIRFMEAGVGEPLVHLHGAGGLRLTRGHDLLTRHFRVVAFEMPGFGASPENTRTQKMPELAETMAAAIRALGIDRFNLMGTSFGAKVALWLAAQWPDRIQSLVLESPAAIRPAGSKPPSGSPEEVARLLYAHPERVGASPTVDLERFHPDWKVESALAFCFLEQIHASARSALPRSALTIHVKNQALAARLRGPDRDADLEAEMRRLATPVLVLFGTLDRIISPEMGRFYKELLPNSHLVFVYDAGHAISVDRPEAFAEVVVDFLLRGEAFVVSRAETVIHP